MDHKLLMLRASLAATFIIPLLCLGALAQGFNADYLPFSNELLRPFAMKRVAVPDDLHGGKPLVVSGVTIVEEVTEKPGSASAGTDSETIRQLVFSGRDLKGKEWRLKTEGCSYCEAVYQGDLDHNGVRDLILASGTGGNGLAPPTYLIFLTFDRQGAPSLFRTAGFYELRESGIFEVADLDGDGRAELVYMAFDDGYWITNIYQMRDGRWRRAAGRVAGLRFPLYTRFTKLPNHTPVRPARGRHPLAPDLLRENAKYQPRIHAKRRGSARR